MQEERKDYHLEERIRHRRSVPAMIGKSVEAADEGRRLDQSQREREGEGEGRGSKERWGCLMWVRVENYGSVVLCTPGEVGRRYFSPHVAGEGIFFGGNEKVRTDPEMEKFEIWVCRVAIFFGRRGRDFGLDWSLCYQAGSFGFRNFEARAITISGCTWGCE